MGGRKARDEQQEARDNRYSAFQTLWDIAVAAGVRAFGEAQPVPMVVQQHANSFDDSSKVVKEWNVPDGVCGMAWLVSRPGGSSFSHWVAKTQGSSAAYGGGKYINLPFGRSSQSLERKTAGANAMADVLEAGLKELDPKTTVWAHSRID